MCFLELLSTDVGCVIRVCVTNIIEGIIVVWWRIVDLRQGLYQFYFCQLRQCICRQRHTLFEEHTAEELTHIEQLHLQSATYPIRIVENKLGYY